MLKNRDQIEALERIRAVLKDAPELLPVVEWLDAAPEWVTLDVERKGLELAPARGPAASPRRSRLKLFRAREGKDRFCAFFYKRSNLPWNRDRFSYGGVEFIPERVSESEVRGWLQWLVSGLAPDRRPEKLRRAFLYDVPD
jgi:hypothetical protein